MGSPNATIFMAARAPSQETKLPQSKGQMMMATMMMMTCYGIQQQMTCVLIAAAAVV